MTVTSEGLPLISKIKIGCEEGVSSFPHTVTSGNNYCLPCGLII